MNKYELALVVSAKVEDEVRDAVRIMDNVLRYLVVRKDA